MKTNLKIPLTDEIIAKKTGLTKTRVGNYRREMQKLPSQTDHLANGGKMIYLDGFNSYLTYRLTDPWRKEMGQFTKMMRGAK